MSTHFGYRILAVASLAIALSSCNGGGSASSPPTAAPTATPTTAPTATPTTAPTATPTTAPTATPTTAPTATPAGVPTPTWTFGGSSTTMTTTAGQTPAQASLAAYSNISVAVNFVTAASASGTLKIGDALNAGDVAPATLPADNATAGYTAVIYLSIYNPGTADISFGTQTPSVQVTKTTGFGGATSCEFDVYGSNGQGNTLSWFSPGGNAAPAGTSVTISTINLGAGNSVDIASGKQQIIAIACK